MSGLTIFPCFGRGLTAECVQVDGVNSRYQRTIRWFQDMIWIRGSSRGNILPPIPAVSSTASSTQCSASPLCPSCRKIISRIPHTYRPDGSAITDDAGFISQTKTIALTRFYGWLRHQSEACGVSLNRENSQDAPFFSSERLEREKRPLLLPFPRSSHSAL